MTHRSAASAVVALAALALLVPAAAHAQSPSLRRHHVTVSAGLLTEGGYAVGARSAELRRNLSPPASPFPLFTTNSDFDRVAGLEARVGVALTRALAIEVGGAFAKPMLKTTIGNDPESTGATVVTDQVSRYIVDISGVWHLPFVRFGSRARPYVIGGGGYLRELHEDRLIVASGRVIHAGAGVSYWVRGGDATRLSLGARADARMVRRSRGIEFEGRDRTYPALSVLGFVGF